MIAIYLIYTHWENHIYINMIKHGLRVLHGLSLARQLSACSAWSISPTFSPRIISEVGKVTRLC